MFITQILFLEVFILLIALRLPTSDGACNQNIIAVKDSVIMFSKVKQSYENANEACASYGMKLATIDFVKANTHLSNALRYHFTPEADTGRLWIRYISYDKDIHRYDQGYVPSQSVWKSTADLGQLFHLDYYKNTAPGRIRLEYCFNNVDGNGYFLFSGSCKTTEGWHFWNVYYFEPAYRPGLKQYFLFGNTRSSSDKIRQVNETYRNFLIYKGTFFGPVVQTPVYVGATYNAEEKKWIGYDDDWEPQNIPAPANPSCDKMALRYTNGWKGGGTCAPEDNYLCQVKFKPLVRVKPLDKTSIEISWDNRMAYFASRMGSLNIAKITASVDGGKISKTRTSGVLITLENLSSACHDVHVSVDMVGCQNFSIAASTKIATGDRIPTPLKHASVDNSTQSQCIVQVSPPKYVDDFQILAVSADVESFHSFTSNNNSLMNFAIDLKQYQPNAKVNLTISYTYCGHQSDIYQVQGFCVRPDPTKYAFLDIRTNGGKGIVAGACFLFLLVVLAVGGFCFISKRRNRPERTTKENNIDGPKENSRGEPVYDKPIFPDELYENPLDENVPTKPNYDDSYQNEPNFISRI